MTKKGKNTMSVINEFMEYYISKLDFYREAARICAQICETNMEQMGIRTIVTSRAKKPERLRNKLEKRSSDKNYTSFDEISKDIADLSGVRIALYFPGDSYKVGQFIESAFQLKTCKVFPELLPVDKEQEGEYRKRFSGYGAMHFRVYMKEKDLPEAAKKYSDTMIEIQVASVLMHAWSEVEHDLLYKPFSGELSYEEDQILDELNGLVLAGEIALERLQKAVKNRVSQVGKEFNNHYELAMFLYNKLGSATKDSQKEILIGRADLLFNAIKSTSYNEPKKLKELIQHIDMDNKNRSIVDQIIDKISELDPEVIEKYRNVKRNEELKYQMETLHMNHENGNRQGEANTLANIGYIYSSKENFDEAISFFTKAVTINHEIGGIQGEANQLINLGSTYRSKGELDKALIFCNQAIELHMQINYKQGQANAIGIIGNIYSDSGNFDEALKCYLEAINIYRETSYRVGQVIQLNNLGLLYVKKQEFEHALDYFNQAVKVCVECEYKQGQKEALHHIGNIFFEQGKFEEALQYYKKALSVQEFEGNQKTSIGILISMGKTYAKRGEVSEALFLYKQAFETSNDIEYKNGAEIAQASIATLQSIPV